MPIVACAGGCSSSLGSTPTARSRSRRRTSPEWRARRARPSTASSVQMRSAGSSSSVAAAPSSGSPTSSSAAPADEERAAPPAAAAPLPACRRCPHDDRKAHNLPMSLPTGTVTFLFTDIEGSTRLLHELGERYADALAEHRRVLRDAFARHGGVEVDTQGDAFFVAFARATDAVAAARDAQAALAGGVVRVRMGLHTGEPTLTEEG